MRCLSCGAILSDEEAVRKFPDTTGVKNPEDQYLDLCNHCLGKSVISSVEDEEGYGHLLVDFDVDGFAE